MQYLVNLYDDPSGRADVRGWYEERTTSKGFQHIEPLWGERPAAEVPD